MRTSFGQKTLEAKYYRSDSVFRQEIEKIFSRRWLFAGRSRTLAEPGNYFLFKAAGEEIILLKDRAGQIRGFYNLCRHRGTRLCEMDSGRFSGSIQCPYHAWTYDLEGRLIGAPNMKDAGGFDGGDYGLHPVRIALWDGFVFVSLAPDPRAFEQSYAPIVDRFSPWRLADLDLVESKVYEIEANWKLIFQNYSECYHCPTVHPALNQLTPYRHTSNDLDEGPILGGPMEMSDPRGSMTLDGKRCASPLGTVSGDALRLVYYYTLFPNMFLSLHPDYVMTHRIAPLTPSRTRVTCEWLFDPAASQQPGYNPDSAVGFWDQTNRQDWRVCELSQRGISSRAYSPGPYSELESLLAAFDREYLSAMR